MALRPAPSSVEYANFTIRPSRTQIVQISGFTGSQQVINRGPSTWQGSLSIPFAKTAGQAREIMAWLVSMDGASNHTHISGRDVKEIRPDFTSPRGPNWIIDTIESDDYVTIDTNINDVDYGQVFRVGNFFSVVSPRNSEVTRTFIVTDLDLRGRRVELNPKGVLQVGQIVSSEPVLSVNFSEDENRPETEYTPDFNGSWSLQWREILG